MNQEAMMNQSVVLLCDDCGKKTDAKTRDKHVDAGWNWQEFEVKDLGIERVAFCSDCFEPEKYSAACDEYIERRVRKDKSLEQFA